MFTSQRHIRRAALRDFRPTISREAGRAHALRSTWTNCASQVVRRQGLVFVVAGRFDRSAIMRAALVQARARQGVNGAAWVVCLADALRGVWAVARAQRSVTKH